MKSLENMESDAINIASKEGREFHSHPMGNKEENMGELYLKNQNEYDNYIKSLQKKYGNEIPHEEIFRFNFDWGIRIKH